MLVPISNNEFLEAVNIRFDTILEGFEKFKSKTLLGEQEFEEAFIKFIEQVYKRNGEENCYIDFYYNKLTKENRETLKGMLNSVDKSFIIEFEKSYDEKSNFFKFKEKDIPTIVRLNTNEIFFSTFYFTKEPVTIWANHNKKFPIFYYNDNVIIKYVEIAKNNGVCIL